eukprot:m.172061 g.172061  ORF g.172061 m.172061 type:complete len:63 (+) comp39077_c0_seq16:4555-4743(+)
MGETLWWEEWKELIRSVLAQRAANNLDTVNVNLQRGKSALPSILVCRRPVLAHYLCRNCEHL